MNLYIFLVIITILICVFLAFIVLVQNPKGGGLDATFGGVSSNTFGAKRTTDFLEKGTWYLAVALLVVSLGTSLFARTQYSGTNANATPRTQGVDVDPGTTQENPADVPFQLPTEPVDGGSQDTDPDPEQ